jgi:hypothetical protein
LNITTFPRSDLWLKDRNFESQAAISLGRNASSHERSKAIVIKGCAFFMTVKSQHSRQSIATKQVPSSLDMSAAN